MTLRTGKYTANLFAQHYSYYLYARVNLLLLSNKAEILKGEQKNATKHFEEEVLFARKW